MVVGPRVIDSHTTPIALLGRSKRAGMFPEVIQTPRLRFERFDAAVDVATFYEYAGERRSETIGEEAAYVTWEPHDHPKHTADVIDGFREGWEAGEAATYAVVPREGEPGAGEFAGNTGISFEWDRRTATLGIWLRKPFWGRGYSGERAKALARLAFDRFDVDVLAVEVVPDNENSVSAIERYVSELGGRREGRLRNTVTDEAGVVSDSIRFSVAREEYREAGLDVELDTRETMESSALATD